MKKTTKKGFTLIELLAVIVILAIIALIAVPVILNIIDKANKSAFKDTAYSIISAGELYFAEQQLEVNGMQGEKTFVLPDTTNTLGLKGNIPTGSITITRDGKISLMIKNERYCVTKGLEEDDITITEEPENCTVPSGGSGNQGTGGNTQNNLVTDITLNTASVSIINGGTYQIEATVTPTTALNKTLIYTSNNEDVATVTNTGLITGVAGGTATITVATTDGTNISKTVEVTVREQVTSFELSTDSVSIDTGKSETVTAIILPENAYNKVLNWVSSNDTIATVTNGVITGVNAGTTTITVTTADGSNISKIINVTVNQGEKKLSDLATTSTGVTSIPACVTNGSKCAEGTPIAIKVNNDKVYNFYVVSEENNKVTLIMDRNLGDTVAYISKKDYNNDVDYGNYGNNNKGPITVLNYLTSQIDADNWENIPEIESYEYINYPNSTEKYGYQKLNITNGSGLLTSRDGSTTNLLGTMRARLLTYEEQSTLITNNGNKVPKWLYGNLDFFNTCGYWLLTAVPSSSYIGLFIDYTGYASEITTANSVSHDNIYGARPVIELTK